MATSPLFGWQEPDDTSLVKDGAAAIRTLGNAIDSSIGDLLGGTTGQVLAKASNTNMDFTWVAQDDSNAIQNAIVDAKGDLIAATANDTPARLAVGANGETLVADSSTSTGLRYQGAMAAGKNFLINGNYDIWQRSTSGTISGNGYPAADRWLVNVSASGTSSRQTTGAPSGSQYYARNTFTSLSTINYFQLIETANVSQLWGKTVTFSIKVRRNATLAANVDIVIAKSATVDAGIGGGYGVFAATAINYTLLPTGTTSSDWYTASITATIPADGTANSLYVGIQSNNQANGAYLDFSQAQLELGSVATAFSRTGGTIQGELAACQRYYTRFASTSASNFSAFGFGITATTTTSGFGIQMPVAMRTNAAAVDFSTLRVVDLVAGVATAVSAVTMNATSTPYISQIDVTNGTQTAGRQSNLSANNTTAAYIGFSAEL